MANISY